MCEEELSEVTLKEYVLIIIVVEIDKDNDTALYLLKERKNTLPLWLQQTLSRGSD